MLTKEIQETYSVETIITKGTDGTHHQDPVYFIDFKSTDKSKNEIAKQSLQLLFNGLAIKILDEQAGNDYSLNYYVY